MNDNCYICFVNLAKAEMVNMKDVFEHIERKVYKHTFLQQVDVNLEYPIIKKDELTSAFVGLADAFFRNHFHAELNEIPLSEKNIFFKDDDQQLAFRFTPIASMLSVGYKNYNTFYDSVIPHLYPLKEYVFNVLGRDEVRTSLRKVNVFSVEKHTELDQVKQDRLFLQNVISSALLNTEASKSEVIIEGENTEVSVRKFQIDGFTLELRTYFLHRKEGLISLFLDSIVSFDADVSNVEDLLKKANDILFDVYHWSVSEGIIDIMNNDSEV